MGSFANSLFKIMLGWLQAAVSAVWSAFTNEKGNSIFNWIGSNWILIAGILFAIGLAADLCVYIFRWKPFRVWKSFFSRNSDAEESSEEEPVSVHASGDRRMAQTSRRNNTVPEPVQMKQAVSVEEPDFTQWEETTEEQVIPEVQHEEKPVMVTNAGYVVPEDSPYRRPTDKPSPYKPFGQENDIKENRAAGTDRNEMNPVTPRRRRRLNVTELFTDPEEELRQFDAPQHVIDSRKAYRDPVYPRGWQKSEEKEE